MYSCIEHVSIFVVGICLKIGVFWPRSDAGLLHLYRFSYHQNLVDSPQNVCKEIGVFSPQELPATRIGLVGDNWDHISNCHFTSESSQYRNSDISQTFLTVHHQNHFD